MPRKAKRSDNNNNSDEQLQSTPSESIVEKTDATTSQHNEKKQRLHAPTVRDIIGDELTQLSIIYWAPLGSEQKGM